MNRAVPIVVVAYNRPNSLARILKSLSKAHYNRNDVPLIISIDKGENADVLKVAEDFKWNHGEKLVYYQKENLKLRKHIIKCAGYALEYGNVIILEDDLYVSPYFYDYAVEALEYSESRDYIGGVSLYNHRYNVVASEPFEPMDDEYDNWYFQFASSWGEAWTKKQWSKFVEWYDTEPDINSMRGLPQYVKNWPASSWLKYFVAFLIEKDRFFIYPKMSLTTNFGDAGTHVNSDNTNFQVPIQMSEVVYHFSELSESYCVYDAYYESIALRNICEGYTVSVDLYGKKPLHEIKSTSYLLTRKTLEYKIIKQFGCCMRPHDANIINEISGNDFYLYDLSQISNVKPISDSVRKAQYNLRYVDHSQYKAVLQSFFRITCRGVKRKWSKFIQNVMKNNAFARGRIIYASTIKDITK